MLRAPRILLLTLVLGVAAFATVACATEPADNGGATRGIGDGTDPRVPAGAPYIDQDNLKFIPTQLTVKVGQTVYFLNSETALHTVDINGENLSGNMRKGDVFTWTPPAPGVYQITCKYHPQMKATITVVE
jgi:plastocyanin